MNIFSFVCAVFQVNRSKEVNYKFVNDTVFLGRLTFELASSFIETCLNSVDYTKLKKLPSTPAYSLVSRYRAVTGKKEKKNLQMPYKVLYYSETRSSEELDQFTENKSQILGLIFIGWQCCKFAVNSKSDF